MKKAITMITAAVLGLTAWTGHAGAAKIGATEYATLAEAFRAAQPGDTVTLLADLTETDAPGSCIVYDMAGVTFDLNGHTYSHYNFAHVFEGTGGVIKNGTMICLVHEESNNSYALFIGDEGETTSFTVENVTMTGGVNIYNATGVVLKNLNVNGTKYYAVWMDEGSAATIESGTYSAATNSVALLNGDPDSYGLAVEGGTFKANDKPLMGTTGGTLTVSGGTFDTPVDAKFCAEGYAPAKNEDGTYGIAETVTVSGDVRDSNDSVVGDATCTIEFASYDGETIITTASDFHNDAAYSVTLPSGKKYRVWFQKNNSFGSSCGETILDLNGVTEPVTDLKLKLSKAAYCVSYNGDDKRYFVSLDFAEAFAVRVGNAESLTPWDDVACRLTLASRDWTHTPLIALRSAANTDVYAFLKPTSADASNYVACAAFTTGVKIPANSTTPESAITMSLKDVPGETAQTLTLAYEVELRASSDASESLLTTPKAVLPKTEIELVVPGKTEDVEVTYDGEGHFITVNTNGFSKIDISYALSENGPFRSLKKTGTLTNVCVQTVYYTLSQKDFYVNVCTNFATVTIRPRKVTFTSGSASKTYDGEPLTNGVVTVGGDGFVDGEGATFAVAGSQTSAGSSANMFTYALNDGTLATNYVVTTVEGTLSVTAASTAPDSGSDGSAFDGKAQYDGEAHTINTNALNAAVQASFGSGAMIVYALGSETSATNDWSATAPTASDVGTYFVWYKVTSDNYTDYTSVAKLMIGKQTISVLPDGTVVTNVSDHVLHESVSEAFAAARSETFRGYLYSISNAVAGTIQVKTTKAKTNRKTGLTTSTVAATIALLGEKKVTLRGTMDLAEGVFRATAKDGRKLVLAIDADGMSGTFGDYVIDAMRDFFASKDKEEKALANEVVADWKGNYSLVWGDATNGWNTLSVTVASRGRTRVSGTLATGVKVSATAQMVVGERWCCVPVVIDKKNAQLAFGLWFSTDGEEADVEGLPDAMLGEVGGLDAPATFQIDVDAICDLLGDDTFAAYLPDGLAVDQVGAKWVVADGAKAGKVVIDRKTGEVDEAKAGVNPSALKLTFQSKYGTFTGSFRAYYLNAKGALKSQTVTVRGLVVDGVGYGTATVGKFGSVAVVIE